MENKFAIKFFTIILSLVTIYTLSFNFAAKNFEKLAYEDSVVAADTLWNPDSTIAAADTLWDPTSTIAAADTLWNPDSTITKEEFIEKQIEKNKQEFIEKQIKKNKEKFIENYKKKYLIDSVNSTAYVFDISYKKVKEETR